MLVLDEKDIPEKVRARLVRGPRPKKDAPDAQTVLLQQIAASLQKLVAVTAAQPQEAVSPSMESLAARIGGLVDELGRAKDRRPPRRKWKFEITRNYNGFISGVSAVQV